MELLTLIVTLAIVIFTLIYICWRWQCTYWERRGVDSLPTTFPVGNSLNMILQRESISENIMNAYFELKKKNVLFGGYYFFSRPILIPIDLELCRRIMVTDFEYFPNHSLYLDKENPLSGHIYALRSEKWKVMRNKLSPAFTLAKNKMMFPTVSKGIDDLIEMLDVVAEKGEAIDMYEHVAKMGLEVISSCAFGLEEKVLKDPNSQLRKYSMQFFTPSFIAGTLHLLAFLYPSVLSFFRLRMVSKEITDFFFNLIKQTVEYRENNKIIRPDFMHMLLQIKNNANIAEDDIGSFEKSNETQALTMEELAAQSLVFMIGGYETSSATATFCLYELAYCQEVQDKARTEILKALEKHNGKLTYDVVSQLPYLDQCVSETLRKYPISPTHMRECSKTYKIPDSDVVIEQGTYIFISALAIQRDPEYYPDPDKFDPERFSDENKEKRPKTAYMPFGLGPRICIAYTFGVMQVKITLAKILSRYKFKMNPKTKYPIEINPHTFPILPRNDIWLELEKL
ncbi:hypothetical protein RN001_015066 [Aquatica leii]|uniref:Cytochrome P450 n=1 Tax=Aquatica leii TaxID=1421715 RepID=A0AAN7PQ63_9COLE|nr:hypothetical protein RN001_015066 [Aquatica leii]